VQRERDECLRFRHLQQNLRYGPNLQSNNPHLRRKPPLTSGPESLTHLLL
jgi:hypothetical protein